MSSTKVLVSYYSDILCVWAYIAQVRLDELVQNFGGKIEIAHRFVPIFGDTSRHIGHRWKDRGGFGGYARHVHEVGDTFEHINLHPDVWKHDAPASSLGVHLFLKAAALTDPSTVGELAWQLRLAFFQDRRDIARLETQQDLARQLRIPLDPIRDKIEDGSAFAALAADHDSATQHGITGSPTFLFNEGRQKLYGNVGYRIVEANIEELLRDDRSAASWC